MVPNSNATDLTKLDEVARRLGCHVETLRIRVRDGRLAAVRGPHGAYLLSEESLRDLLPPRRGQPPARIFTNAEMEDSWSLVGSILGASERWRQRELEFVNLLRDHPNRLPALFRLVAVHRLRRIGVSFSQIAEELGISSRQARRLWHRRPYMAIRRQLTREDARATAR